MTREEAAALLDVSVDASASEVRKRFQEAYSDLQVRLSNAMTPALKSSYQKNLQRIQEACALLVPGFTTDSQLDLPSAEPMRGTPPPAAPRHRISTQGGEPSRSVPGADANSLPKPVIVAASIAAVCAAGMVFFALKWNQTLKAHQASAASVEKQAESVAAAQGRLQSLEQTEAMFTNGKFRVCNESRAPITVTSLAAAYRKPDGALATVNSGFFGHPTWTIRNDGQREFEFVQGTDVVWDGSVLFYAMEVSYEGDEYFLAGTWSEVKGNCLKLSLDQ